RDSMSSHMIWPVFGRQSKRSPDLRPPDAAHPDVQAGVAPTEATSPARRRIEAFGATTDPRLVWRADQYDEALNVLKAAVLDKRNRLLILTGDPGTGKTLLSHVLADELGIADARVGRLLYPDLEGIEFARGIAQAFGQPTTFKTERGFLSH